MKSTIKLALCSLLTLPLVSHSMNQQLAALTADLRTMAQQTQNIGHLTTILGLIDQVTTQYHIEQTQQQLGTLAPQIGTANISTCINDFVAIMDTIKDEHLFANQAFKAECMDSLATIALMLVEEIYTTNDQISILQALSIILDNDHLLSYIRANQAILTNFQGILNHLAIQYPSLATDIQVQAILQANQPAPAAPAMPVPAPVAPVPTPAPQVQPAIVPQRGSCNICLEENIQVFSCPQCSGTTCASCTNGWVSQERADAQFNTCPQCRSANWGPAAITFLGSR